MLTSQCLSFVLSASAMDMYIYVLSLNVKMHADIFVECMSLEKSFVGGTYVYVRRRKKLACPEAVKAYYRMGLAYLARDQFDLAKVGTLA